MNGYQITSGLIWYLVFLFSTTCHEAAHAFVAWKGGDDTAYHGGQVSLSPIPHLRREPIGMFILPLATALTQGWAIGWASTPYDPRWEARYPKRAALMAAAGPGANLALALIAFTALKIGLPMGWFDIAYQARDIFRGSPQGVEFSYAGQVLFIVLLLNVLLFCLNLLPFPPLDGGSAWGLVLPESTARQLRDIRRNPTVSMIGLVVVFFGFRYIAGPIVATVRFLVGI